MPQFVAIGTSGTIVTSPDGVEWTNRYAPLDNYTSISYGNSNYIITGNTTTLVSTDAVSWTKYNFGISDNAPWTGIARKYDGSLLVAVADGLSYAKLSTDGGIQWSNSNLPFTTRWIDIIYNGSVFCTISTQSSPNRSAITTDGITWNSGTLPTNSAYYSAIAWKPNIFCVVSGGRPGGWTNSNNGAVSTDGITWSNFTLPSSTYWTSIASDGNIFFAVNSSGTTSISGARSTNGTTWTSVTMPNSNYSKIIWADNKFFAINGHRSSGNSLDYSTDGTTWSTATLPYNVQWRNIIWTGTYFCATAGDNGYYAVSTNGISWTGRTLTTFDMGYTHLANTNNDLIIAIGGEYTRSNTTAYITQTAGIRSPETINKNRMHFNGTSFTTAMNSGFVSSTTDGISWQLKNTGTTNNLNEYKILNGLHIAVGMSGTIVTSTDGVTWNTRTSGTSSALFSVDYGNGVYIVAGDAVVISTNGITWTTGTNTTNRTNKLKYNGKYFIASEFTNLQLTLDGKKWITPTTKPGSITNLNGIAYSNNTTVIVGDNQTILKTT